MRGQGDLTAPNFLEYLFLKHSFKMLQTEGLGGLRLSSEWNFLRPAPNTPGQPAHPPWETYLWSDLASTDDTSFTGDEKTTPPHRETFPSPEHVFM